MTETAQQDTAGMLARFEAANWRRTDISLLPTEVEPADVVRDAQWFKPYDAQYIPADTPRLALGRIAKIPVGVPLRGLVSGRYDGSTCRMYVPDVTDGRIAVYNFQPIMYNPDGSTRMMYGLEMCSVLLHPDDSVTVAACSLSAAEMYLLLANATVAALAIDASVLVTGARTTPMIAPFAADGARMAEYLNAQVEQDDFRVLSVTPVWMRRYTAAGPSKYGYRKDSSGTFNYDGLGWAVHITDAAGVSIVPHVLVDAVGNFVISSWCQREGKGGTSNEAYHGRDVPYTLKTWLLGAYTIRMASDYAASSQVKKQIKPYVPPKFIPPLPQLAPGMTPLMAEMLKNLRRKVSETPLGAPGEITPSDVYPRMYWNGSNRIIILGPRAYAVIMLAGGVVSLKYYRDNDTTGLTSPGVGTLADYGFSPEEMREIYAMAEVPVPAHLKEIKAMDATTADLDDGNETNRDGEDQDDNDEDNT